MTSNQNPATTQPWPKSYSETRLMQQDRSTLRRHFQTLHGWGEAEVAPLSGDASFRRYFRLQQNGMRALLMDCPPGKENLSAFLTVGEHLISLGLSAPDIYATDTQNGFAIIEDFGDTTFTHLLGQGIDPHPLYIQAVETLIALHAHPDTSRITLPAYDMTALLEEAVLLPLWQLPARRGKKTQQALVDSYQKAWRDVISPLPDMKPTLVLRDFHVDNLMLLQDRTGPAACGLLDFQDALIGHPAYDLMSLLEDARRHVPDDIIQTMRTRYEETMTDDKERQDFSLWYDVLAAQRHAKIGGIFMRLFLRDGKDRYLTHIPHVMQLLERHIVHPHLAPVKAWLDKNMPDRLEPLPGMDLEALRSELAI